MGLIQASIPRAQVSWGFAQPSLNNLQGWRPQSLGNHPSGGLLNKFLLNLVDIGKTEVQVGCNLGPATFPLILLFSCILTMPCQHSEM